MLLTREEVFGKVAEIISNHFELDKEKVTPELSIKDDLNADSISIMEFILELEDEFGTEISDDEAERIETVGAAVDYILEHQG
ncbi:acyl carrier protein [Enterococcus sp. 669A]|uniref:Acyl carrier protein n=1 Tax=Candidatus Enterococcus moelleringii TaxID=2815325 RepID=A0ABS3L892_9ENTE|nr:acyl carrier protein [Enterococcus sp. 669A]